MSLPFRTVASAVPHAQGNVSGSSGCLALVLRQVAARARSTAIKGRWKISGNELCVSVPIGADYCCRTAVRSGKSFILRANRQDLYEAEVEARSAKFHFD